MASEYDIRYKKLFSNPVLLQELLQYFVHEDFISELDFSTLERIDKSFITDRFKEKESDLIYKINYKGKELYVYLLIEFQSTVDRFMSLRILRYICEFYEYLTQNKIRELPPVFPLLLYNGDAKWTAPLNIKELIQHTIPDHYIPDFAYYPILENEISKKTLLSIQNAVSAVFFIENSNIEEIRNNIEKIINLLQTEQPEIIILFKNWVNNLLGFVDKDINKSLSDLGGVRDMFATALKKYKEELKEELKVEVKEEVKEEVKKEALKEGIKKGVDKGSRDQIIKTAGRMLDLNFSIEDIINVTGLSREEIESLK